MTIIESRLAEHIKDFANRLRHLASSSGETVQGRHNGLLLTATPASTIDDVLEPFTECVRKAAVVTAPVRVQRQRRKGWRMPANTIDCTRPGKFGNPYVPGRGHGFCGSAQSLDCHPLETNADAVANFRLFTDQLRREAPADLDRMWIAPLRGKNLACWCRLCDKHRQNGKPADEACADCAPCHTDVIFECLGYKASPP